MRSRHGGRRRSSPVVAVPVAAAAPRRRRRLLGKVGRSVAAVGVLVAAVFGTLFAVQPANAADVLNPVCELDGGRSGVGPEFFGGGATFWIPTVNQEDGPHINQSRHTLWEVAGPRGLSWSYEPMRLSDDGFDDSDGKKPKENFEEECSPVDATGAAFAQMLWEPSRFLGGLTIALKQLATNESPFSAITDEQQRLLDNMRTYIGVPALTVAVALAGYWVAYRMTRNVDQRETYSGVITSAVIVILIALVLAGNNYSTITREVDRFTSQFNSAMMEIISVGGDKHPVDPCYLPEGVENEGKRTSTCLLYEVLLYQPWHNGLFGSDQRLVTKDLTFNSDLDGTTDYDHCRQREVDESGLSRFDYRCAPQNRQFPDTEGTARINLAVQQVIAQAVTRKEYTSASNSNQNVNITNHHLLWTGVKYAVGDRYPSLHDRWRGAEPSGRMATAVAALVVNLIALIFIGLLALLTIFWHGVFLISWVFLPIIGAVAAYPPARRIVKTIVGIMVQAVFLRCVFGVILAVLLAVLNSLQVSDGLLPLKVLLMLIAAAAIWKLLSALRTGAAPQISQEAMQTGAMPSDTMATSTATVASRQVRQATGGAVRRYRGTMAGARAGRRVGEEAASNMGYQRGSDEWKQTVSRSRREGASTGYRASTGRGREQLGAENQVAASIGAPLDRRVRQKQRNDDVQRQTSWRKTDEKHRERRDKERESTKKTTQARRAKDQELYRQRHDEVIDRLDKDGGGG